LAQLPDWYAQRVAIWGIALPEAVAHACNRQLVEHLMRVGRVDVWWIDGAGQRGGKVAPEHLPPSIDWERSRAVLYEERWERGRSMLSPPRLETYYDAPPGRFIALDRAQFLALCPASTAERAKPKSTGGRRQNSKQSQAPEIVDAFIQLVREGRVRFGRGGLRNAARILSPQFADYELASIENVIRPSFNEAKAGR
jgi:hypothetical protein